MKKFNKRLSQKNRSVKPQQYVLMNKQRGTVLMEFIVIVSLVLVPLFIGLTFIGKYIDNAQKVEVAARYSAWERTAWYQKLPSSLKKADENIATEKSAEELGFELENRVFSNSNSGIYLAQKTKEINEESDPITESFWLDDNSRISIYKKNEESTSTNSTSTNNSNSFIQVSDGKPAKMYGYTAGALNAFFNLIGGLSGFDVKIVGAMSTNVDLTLVQPSFLKDYTDGDLAISRSQTILADGWNAAGPSHAKTRSQGLVSGSLADNSVVSTLQGFLKIIPVAKEIDSDSLIFGQLAIDAVPESRLDDY